jgi:adenylate cyclase
MEYPFEIEEDPGKLAELSFWTKQEYADLMACRKGEMTEDAFRARYQKRAAILCLDMTGFTKSTLRHNALYSFYRILDVQKICYPVFKAFNADIIHSFADNFTVIFSQPRDALGASFEAHKRVELYYKSTGSHDEHPRCCIGIGYGDVYSIGHDKAMGDEMNRASVLGEDTAGGAETLVTERVYNALKTDANYVFSLQSAEDVPFPFYSVQKKEERSAG